MTDAETFNAAQEPCKITGKKPRLHYTGIHVIACCANCACSIHDGNASSPETIIKAWTLLHPQSRSSADTAPPTTKLKSSANELYPRFKR